MKKQTLEEKTDLTHEEYFSHLSKLTKNLTVEEASKNIAESLPTQEQLYKTFSSYKDVMTKFIKNPDL